MSFYDEYTVKPVYSGHLGEIDKMITISGTEINYFFPVANWATDF